MKKTEKTLAERMAAEVAASAPSLIPVAVEYPPKPEEVVPDLRTLIKSPADRLRLMKMATEAYQLKREIAAGKKGLDGRRKDLGGKSLLEAIKEILTKYGIEGKGLFDDLLFNYYNSPRKSLSTQMLLNAGVLPSVINSCYEEKDSWTLRVDMKADESDKEEE